MRVLAVLVAAVAATGSSDAPPSLATACGSAPAIAARPLWLTTSDGVRLYAVEAGDGAVGVVLAHQGRSDLCEELPYAKTLVDVGLHVLAFDFRGNGRSARPAKRWLAYRSDFAAAVKQLHADGAPQVFLVGASMGGAAAVQNSAGLPVAGIVSLSGTRLWPGYGINKPGPRALRAPFLYVGSRNDWRAPLKEAWTIVRKVGSRDKRGVFYRGSLHGWQLVQDAPFAAKARALILAWIRSR
jgi:alpha-beta hydrolase superfamily lysophospholipase